ncbi:hypothetical protein Cgig2_026363 [Carnegiea gigantea]|uniref:Peroxisomal membrane protein PEX16 n=1 Tax=Carnegiea gigantea TaxID=171969 RepID=A0A9Q1KE28_9CARY|nr:hypothetical protein Cgig2_026363 [Carnegiea gigantea]
METKHTQQVRKLLTSLGSGGCVRLCVRRPATGTWDLGTGNWELGSWRLGLPVGDWGERGWELGTGKCYLLLLVGDLARESWLTAGCESRDCERPRAERLPRRLPERDERLNCSAEGLTWLLPERFSASEIGPEAVNSLLGIITAINEYIIDTTPTKWRPPAAPLLPYSLSITALKEVETLVEVVAQQLHGDDNKWNFIIITEASK